MKRITFWLDFISPYAFLAFEKLPEVLQGLSYQVVLRPVLFAGLLKHHGQLGPAEITGKREWTYRQVLWLAHQHRVPLQMPAAHPFNPLPLLRLALAGGEHGAANRHTCEQIFRHVWQGGGDAADATRLQALREQLAPARDPAGDAVKSELKANAEAALALGVFGVPTFTVDDKLFWGFDALPLLRAWLQGDSWFGGDAWATAGAVPVGLSRHTGA